MEDKFIQSVIESLILASPEPLPAKKIADQIDEMTPSKVAKAVADINTRYAETETSFRIREIAGGYQFYILQEFTGYVQEMFTRTRKMRLTKAALETLAIVAYKQPVTKSEIELIRGVASDGVLHNLLEKNMLTIKGRAETVGKPLQYGTTDEFLKFFGLNKVDDLPKMSEIEEMLASAQPDDQPEFELFSSKGNDNPLNVNDGIEDQESEEPAEKELIESKDDIAQETTEELIEESPNAETDDEEANDGIIVDMDRT
ncbi:MAG: SMC-Scp complex subunit ScpB [Calditrichaeota bacterium]|nr:MAG: SMC-Scp complex subunit ScpB [Calditrichota bacterium]